MAEVAYIRSSLYPASVAARIINIVISIIELVLAVRLVLELLGANAGAGFVAWIYNASGNLSGPFNGAFPPIVLSGNSVIDLSTVLAMIAYAIIGWLLIRLVYFAFSAFD